MIEIKGNGENEISFLKIFKLNLENTEYYFSWKFRMIFSILKMKNQ